MHKTFSQKKELKEKGYTDSKLFLNKYLSSIDQWNVAEYKKRYEVIYKRFIQVWKYPKNLVIEDEAEPEFTLDELEDTTFSKVNYFVFRDQMYEVSTHKEILEKLVRILLEEEPDYFFNTDLENLLKITNNPTDAKLRSPCKV